MDLPATEQYRAITFSIQFEALILLPTQPSNKGKQLQIKHID